MVHIKLDIVLVSQMGESELKIQKVLGTLWLSAEYGHL